uniref:Putative RNA-directed DNA polymerase n=1 Tax=Schizaphis graminum TaxID=13262 RepID=A0A2S2PCV7_SCHGA
MLNPIWSYNIQIWGYAKPSQIQTIQAFQSISLYQITSAPWYASNLSLHKDLKIDIVSKIAKNYYKNFHTKTINRTNSLTSNLSSEFIPNNPPPPTSGASFGGGCRVYICTNIFEKHLL